jgi:hypothetical protein
MTLRQQVARALLHMGFEQRSNLLRLRVDEDLGWIVDIGFPGSPGISPLSRALLAEVSQGPRRG